MVEGCRSPRRRGHRHRRVRTPRWVHIGGWHTSLGVTRRSVTRNPYRVTSCRSNCIREQAERSAPPNRGHETNLRSGRGHIAAAAGECHAFRQYGDVCLLDTSWHFDREECADDNCTTLLWTLGWRSAPTGLSRVYEGNIYGGDRAVGGLVDRADRRGPGSQLSGGNARGAVELPVLSPHRATAPVPPAGRRSRPRRGYRSDPAPQPRDRRPRRERTRPIAPPRPDAVPGPARPR